MIGSQFSLNGLLLPISEAQVSIDNLSFVYGFGVYENLKVRNSTIYFIQEHVERLLKSAEHIGVCTDHTQDQIIDFIKKFMITIEQKSYNVKMLLIGKNTGSDLYVFALNPKFIPQKFYTQGVKVITVQSERAFPHAKTLNMLESYLAYTQAKKNNAFDALLVDHKYNIREGTRTNLFFTDGEKIYTTPTEDVLNGVTRAKIIQQLKNEGITVKEKVLHESDIQIYKGYFLTSTSAKVLPIKQIDGYKFEIPEIVKKVMKMFDKFLDTQK
jgi:branched-chain amino acid aminotransferase